MIKKTSILIYPLLIVGVLFMLTISCEKDDPIVIIIKEDVTITWEDPADITAGTPLSAIQLNATAEVPGTFVYTPEIGTSLAIGTNQELKVDFTPTDTASYYVTSKTIKINVIDSIYTDPRDGNVYRLVTIGKQVWMAENLRYLPSVAGPATGSTSTPCYYVYGYNGTSVTNAKATDNYATYGVLYNWPAAMNGATSSDTNPSGVRGICPPGWHLPSNAEWTQLVNHLIGKAFAGGKLKEAGTTHWLSPNTGATNESGFTALPGGYRSDYGSFRIVGYAGYWWSATAEYEKTYAWLWELSNIGSDVNSFDYDKELGYSVRCVRD